MYKFLYLTNTILKAKNFISLWNSGNYVYDENNEQNWIKDNIVFMTNETNLWNFLSEK